MPSKTRKVPHKTRQKASDAPQSFEEALGRGWRVHEQLSSWNFKPANKREGFLILTHSKTSRTLMVKYTALYELSEPYFLEKV
jgi:hypothetical protein